MGKGSQLLLQFWKFDDSLGLVHHVGMDAKLPIRTLGIYNSTPVTNQILHSRRHTHATGLSIPFSRINNQVPTVQQP